MGDKLLYALDRITNQNAQNEYYLTDSLSILLGAGNGANAYVVENSDVVLGANDRAQLHILNEILRHKIMHQWMVDGVDIPCTDGVMIADTVQIGTGTTILPGTILLGNTTIGKDCLIGPNTYIMDGTVGNGVTLDNVKLTDSTVEDGADAGPFVQIRGGSVLHTGVHIGDFVEVKNSTVGAGTKSAHLTYIGDSDVGAGVNFGCGTVTVNYDGKNKSRCKIGDGAFIGCNTNLVAPVEVGDRAYIAAGSTITDDIPGDALSIARARQVNKPGWVTEKKPYKEKRSKMVMKRICTCLLAAALVVGAFTGCAAKPAAGTDTTTKQETTTETTTVTTTENTKTTFRESYTSTIYPALHRKSGSGYSHELASYTTYYDAKNETRTANITASIRKLNNLVIPAGRTFTDFQFKNTSGTDIRLQMTAKNGTLTCKVMGQKNVKPKDVKISIKKTGKQYVLTRTVGGKVNYTTYSTYAKPKKSQ